MSRWRSRNAAGQLSHARDRKGRWARGAIKARGNEAYDAAIKAGFSKSGARSARRKSKAFDRGTAVLRVYDGADRKNVLHGETLILRTGAERGSYYARQQAIANAQSGHSVARAVRSNAKVIKRVQGGKIYDGKTYTQVSVPTPKSISRKPPKRKR